MTKPKKSADQIEAEQLRRIYGKQLDEDRDFALSAVAISLYNKGYTADDARAGRCKSRFPASVVADRMELIARTSNIHGVPVEAGR